MSFPEHDFNAFPELTNAQLELLEFQSPHDQIKEDFWADVVRVHDGDTVTLRTFFRDFDFPLRLADIDTRELSEGGDAARDWLTNKILDKECLILVDPANRVDKYGRLLGRVLFNGVVVNQELVHLGLAVPFDQRKEGVIRDVAYYIPPMEVAY
jgi:endonuclease YncB( thermonuclease family)